MGNLAGSVSLRLNWISKWLIPMTTLSKRGGDIADLLGAIACLRAHTPSPTAICE
ncbi:hypothetical protein [Williamsia sp.]|uniref:hypothetical protein n=1 Tax=Williamsia sp. TaxID=1872085 RepID=UPI0025F6405F|nr:hypothetical protein [Williamsia sp.]